MKLNTVLKISQNPDIAKWRENTKELLAKTSGAFETKYVLAILINELQEIKKSS